MRSHIPSTQSAVALWNDCHFITMVYLFSMLLVLVSQYSTLPHSAGNWTQDLMHALSSDDAGSRQEASAWSPSLDWQAQAADAALGGMQSIIAGLFSLSIICHLMSSCSVVPFALPECINQAPSGLFLVWLESAPLFHVSCGQLRHSTNILNPIITAL